MSTQFGRHVTSGLYVAIVVGASILAIGGVACAQDSSSIKNYTRAKVDDWLRANVDTKPDFKAGDVITTKDLARLRPFLPPGYFEYLDFPDFKAEIIATQDHLPRRDYLDCTEKHQFQVKLRPDGSMENYECGQPFPSQGLSTDDPLSGLKAAWDFNWRWQNFGTAAFNITWTLARFGGTHMPPVPETPPTSVMTVNDPGGKLPSDTREIYGGGGSFPRNLQSTYQRVYFTHLAQMSDQNGNLPVPSAKDFEFKDFIEFFEPFDFRGYAFIVFRYADPFRADDAWGYIPNLRRVRRLTAEVKSDSVLGSDQTLDDFYTFSGRPVDWNWKFLGYRSVLAVADSKYLYSHLYGPIGMVPSDGWSIRRVAVLERTPKNVTQPYSSAVMFWDVENWYPLYSVAFNREGRLWRVQQLQWKWSESYDNEWARDNRGVHAETFQSNQVFDVQNDRGTILMGFGFCYPNVTAEHVARLYDVNKLEEVHR
jgi:uncharacterized protein DUF1329